MAGGALFREEGLEKGPVHGGAWARRPRVDCAEAAGCGGQELKQDS